MITGQATVYFSLRFYLDKISSYLLNVCNTSKLWTEKISFQERYISRGVRNTAYFASPIISQFIITIENSANGTIPIVRISYARGASQRATIGISMALSRKSRVLTHLQFVPTAQPLCYSISDTGGHFAPWRQPSTPKVRPTPPECRTTFFSRVCKLRQDRWSLVALQFQNFKSAGQLN